MTKIDLGLGGLDLTDIKPNAPRPQTPAEQREESAAVDTVGREHGFSKASSPAAIPRRQRATRPGELQHQISIKGPARVMERLMAYCDRERLAYWEAIEKFMDIADGQSR